MAEMCFRLQRLFFFLLPHQWDLTCNVYHRTVYSIWYKFKSTIITGINHQYLLTVCGNEDYKPLESCKH